MRRPTADPTDPAAADGAPTSIDGYDDLLIAELHREVEQLQEALRSRQQIGVAVGLLARRFDCSPQQAWSVLSRISQAMNVKAREIARILGDAQAGQVRPEDAGILEQLAQHLPGGWPLRDGRRSKRTGEGGPRSLE